GAATYALTGRRDGWGTPAAPRRPITIPPAPREAPPPSSIRSVIGGTRLGPCLKKKASDPEAPGAAPRAPGSAVGAGGGNAAVGRRPRTTLPVGLAGGAVCGRGWRRGCGGSPSLALVAPARGRRGLTAARMIRHIFLHD